ncbi:MAG: DUF262 domain-containing protein [Gammaproteobacteria bacterium]|nr:DUF262 domain-containing protein [Gammaproteobacteria bacterium]
MKAGEEKFMDIIKKEVQFKIPIYQRLYDWKIDHCRTLLDDILQLLKNPEIQIHFMGSIVYIDEKGQSRLGSTKELLVIDGQQRITTLTLIFLVLEELANEQNNLELSRKIRNNCLINEYSKLENKNKLILTRKDNEILEKMLRGEDINDLKSKLIPNYNFIENKIKDFIKDFSLEEIYENLNRIMVVDVSLFHGQDNPQQIFESLNATGKALTDGDLIRNFILMNLNIDLQNKIYNMYWYPMESLLEEYITDFIEDYIYMKKVTSTNIKDLYKEFKLFFYKNYNHADVEEVASDLLKYAKYYDIISYEKDNNIDVNKALYDLNILDFYSHYPLLLRIFNEYKKKKLNSDDFVDILKVIESFLFRRSICGIPTNSLNPIFRTIWNELDKNNLKASLIKELKSGEWNKRWPDDKEFEEKLMSNDLYRQRFDKLLLEELEKSDNKEANKDFENLSVEHILPQTGGDPDKLSDEWKKMLGLNYLEIRNKWLHKLGNLTLTGYNPEYSDKNFDEKKFMENGFIDSGLRLNRQVAEYAIWNEDSIKDRANKLAKIAIKRWSYFN